MHYNSAEANTASQKDQRKTLRRNLTPAEATLWRALKGRGAGGWKFRRQQGVGPFILDFFCPELLLCIELDGSVHDYSYIYDEQRTAYLNAQGIRVIRFSNEQVFSCFDGVVAEIVRVCNEIAAEKGVTDPTPNPSLQREGLGVGFVISNRPKLLIPLSAKVHSSMVFFSGRSEQAGS